MRYRGREPRRGKALLVALVSMCLLLAVAVIWVWRQPAVGPTVEEGRQVADRFLADIKAGRASQAWDSTTSEFKSALGREKFLEAVKEHPFLTKPLTFVSVQTASVQGAPRNEYLYRSSKGPGTVRLLAGSDNGSWRVDRMTVAEK